MKPTEELALQFETQRKLIQENAALQKRVDELEEGVGEILKQCLPRLSITMDAGLSNVYVIAKRLMEIKT